MNLYTAKQLIDRLRTVGKNTIQIAEDIPERDYGYRPRPEILKVDSCCGLMVLAGLTESRPR
jgi:hypothetical protein